MKKVYLFISVLLMSVSLYSAPKKNQTKSEFETFNQVIINDTDYPLNITLLNEETHFFDEYELSENEIYILQERLYTIPTGSKKLNIKNPYIYIASIKYISPNECVYLLKSIKKNPDSVKKQEEWDSFSEEDDDQDLFVLNETSQENEPEENTALFTLSPLEEVPVQEITNFNTEAPVEITIPQEKTASNTVPQEKTVPVEDDSFGELIVPEDLLPLNDSFTQNNFEEDEILSLF